jgi:ribulose-phosphate 3-epimerase
MERSPIMGSQIVHNIFNPNIIKQADLLWYRSRSIRIYILIGISSLLVEVILRRLLIVKLDTILSTLISVMCGMILAYLLNISFNFQIPKIRKKRAFLFFLLISILSGLIQLLLFSNISITRFDYASTRFLISGCVFLIVYILHRRLSFKDYKKIGVAIYANGTENLSEIHKKIGPYPNFIHVDIVDKSFSSYSEDVTAYRLETVRALWPKHEIHTHIMSNYPSKWIKQIAGFCDIIFIHWECKENILETANQIKNGNSRAGLAITLETKFDDIIEMIDNFDTLLVLTINEPGRSGQKIDSRAFDIINDINNSPARGNFDLCIDGGINEVLSSKFDAEYLVSGSCVLNNDEPKLQIFKLQYNK